MTSSLRCLCFALRAAVLAACLVLPLAADAASAAEPAPKEAGAPPLRIVGGLAGINQYVRHEEPFWTRELPRLSGGRVSAEIVPFDRAGIRGQEMLRLVQLGAVPFGTALLAVSSSQDPELAAADLAAAHGDIASVRRSVAAFRPVLRRLLAERYQSELLAVYVYPAQVTFCKSPLTSLDDLAGRRIRVSSPTQADWVRGLQATPVTTGFADILTHLRSGNIDCAITGTMSGNTIGLHEVTSHLHTTPVGWGLAAFVANGAAWRGLPEPARALLQRELPRLEQAIWDEAALETGMGIACNTGSAGCQGGRKGHMVEVRESEADRRRREAVFARHVVPAWLQRCGAPCEQVWQQTLAGSAAAGAARP